MHFFSSLPHVLHHTFPLPFLLSFVSSSFTLTFPSHRLSFAFLSFPLSHSFPNPNFHFVAPSRRILHLHVAASPASLYVGDLHSDVSDSHLIDVFSEFKSLNSVRVCKDSFPANPSVMATSTLFLLRTVCFASIHFFFV
ncbi:hypothetical protein V8G54_035484 [Vigna mungo]|uniref:RRM domain-containing protein n=1 Tax=Vigna mungo TaxID=3915 RepID=A0AAQ3MF77_VIGMU